MASVGNVSLASARELVSSAAEPFDFESAHDPIGCAICGATSVDPATPPPVALNLDDASIVAPSDVVQMHKLVVSLVELFVFTGTAYASESVVRLAYPSVPFCAQFDPTRASWLDFLRSVFDLLST